MPATVRTPQAILFTLRSGYGGRLGRPGVGSRVVLEGMSRVRTRQVRGASSDGVEAPVGWEVVPGARTRPTDGKLGPADQADAQVGDGLGVPPGVIDGVGVGTGVPPGSATDKSASR